MFSTQTLARTTGALYLLTFVFSVPALALKQPYLDGGDNVFLARLGAVSEILLALACVGTAVFIYPIIKRHSPALSLGFLGSRILEGGTILSGVVVLLTVISVRQGEAADPALTQALVSVHDWFMLVGPGFLPAVNALMFATVLFRARLVPRWIPLVGLIGAPLLAASAFRTVFGTFDQVSALAAAGALPTAVWEFSIGVYLLVKGMPRAEAVTNPDQ